MISAYDDTIEKMEKMSVSTMSSRSTPAAWARSKTSPIRFVIRAFTVAIVGSVWSICMMIAASPRSSAIAVQTVDTIVTTDAHGSLSAARTPSVCSATSSRWAAKTPTISSSRLANRR